MVSLVRKLRDEKSGHFLWQPCLAGDHPATLLGHPIVVVDDMPPLDTKGVGTIALFGNLKQAYQVVDRSRFSILRDPYSSKPNVEFYVTRRVGGDVINFDALKMLTVG
jgi:HK97 family phage major capsid protein